MTTPTRELLIKLSSHMAYMQGQLEAFTQQSDHETSYWYRQSVALRQKVIDALAEGREPASVVGEPSDRELLDILADSISEACECSSIAIDEYESETGCSIEAFGSELIAFARAVLARYGRPAPGQAVEALTARPLMEQVAALGDIIGEQTVGQVRTLADRAAAWLAANPPGQPTGACSCVELPAPVPVASNVYFEFVVSDADYCTQAGGIAPSYAQALSEGQRYLAQYQQDGPHTLEVRRVENLNPGAFPVPDDAPVAVLPEDAQVIEPAKHAILVPAPVPVPVSERLPGDQLCWWFEADEDCGYGSNWTMLRIRGSATGYTHWLPAHALPVPSGEVAA